MLMTRHFDYCPSASEGDNQSVRSSAPVVSRCFPGGYNVKLYISRGRLAWWLLAFLHSEYLLNGVKSFVIPCTEASMKLTAHVHFLPIQEADLGYPIVITSQRYEDFDFSYFFWEEKCGAIVRLASDESHTLW